MRPDVLFVESGVRATRTYRPDGAVEVRESGWRGACAERRRSPGHATHRFADGDDLVGEWPLGPDDRERARGVLAASYATAPATGDAPLSAFAERHRVSLTLAVYHQRVAVGTPSGLVADERLCRTAEVTLDGRTGTPLSEVVPWDDQDGARRAEIAAGAVRGLAALTPAAGPLPACDVVLEPGRAGALFHELVGHPLEADVVASRSSYLARRLGERVAPPWLQVTDGAAVPGDGFAAAIDDEGTPVQTVSLVRDGLAEGVLVDGTTSGPLGRASTGHGRRLDYRLPVIPRMRHTAAFAKDAEPEAPGSVRLSPRGLRLRWMNLLTGDFEFAIAGALLEAGEGGPRLVGPAILAGNGLEVLAALRPGPGGPRSSYRASKGCGKLGQFPLVVSFANGGLWIPGEVVHVRADPSA